eukprot:353839-Chlamydomonas_euryale.AAC.6
MPSLMLPRSAPSPPFDCDRARTEGQVGHRLTRAETGGAQMPAALHAWQTAPEARPWMPPRRPTEKSPKGDVEGGEAAARGGKGRDDEDWMRRRREHVSAHTGRGAVDVWACGCIGHRDATNLAGCGLAREGHVRGHAPCYAVF